MAQLCETGSKAFWVSKLKWVYFTEIAEKFDCYLKTGYIVALYFHNGLDRRERRLLLSTSMAKGYQPFCC